MQTKAFEKYFFFGLLLATFIFAFLIFLPFWVVIVLGVSFSIVLYPVYLWIHKQGIPAGISSFITVILFGILLCGPLLGIGALVFNQSQDLYQKVLSNNLETFPLSDRINARVNEILPAGVPPFDVNEKATQFVSYLSSHITNIFTTTLSAFFSFILLLLIIFYLLKDGESWKKSLMQLSPLGEKNDEKIISRLILAINGVIKGSLLIALVQGTLMGLGLWIFGIPNAALWGVVTAILSFIPTFGTALVSVPAIIFLFIKGDTIPAIGLLVWAVALVGSIDNLLGPLIVGRSVKLPSILILFSVLGGISFLGPVGILVGPLTLSLLYALILIYKNEFTQTAE
ncbi:MAG TPA: AI-2E family transporter [Candidatus Paceibacterota bacterium]|jgi:predicted PurR-regulated permease PerM|nr:AI-2E family transporter [Candidatus Paceibacterota bacterium]